MDQRHGGRKKRMSGESTRSVSLLRNLWDALAADWRHQSNTHTPSPDWRRELGLTASPEGERMPRCGQCSEAKRHWKTQPSQANRPPLSVTAPVASRVQPPGRCDPTPSCFLSKTSSSQLWNWLISIKPISSWGGNRAQLHLTQRLC